MKLFIRKGRGRLRVKTRHMDTEERIRDQQRQQPFGATRLHDRQQQQIEPSLSLSLFIHGINKQTADTLIATMGMEGDRRDGRDGRYLHSCL
jgi:hypothetical protein